MKLLNITDEYDNSTKCTPNLDDENDKIKTITKFLNLSFPGGVILLSRIGLLIYTTLNHFLNNKKGQVSLAKTSKSPYQ